MKPEQKELLIKDLCARLPYGVKVVEYGEIYPANLHNISSIAITIRVYEAHSDSIKPILFPLSAINQEIEVGGEKIILTDFYTCINRINGGLETYMNPYIPIDVIWNYIDIFNRYHIDYRGLIDKGLAISVFDLPENPYK